MSILIKGMAMPKNCYECRFGKEKRLDVGIICTLLDGTTFDTTSRPTSMCPLIEFPPHGRLIDADALIAKVREELLSPNNKKGALETMGAMFRDVLDAPTIIESEGEE